jgi:CRP-like cAMP-binding protein
VSLQQLAGQAMAALPDLSSPSEIVALCAAFAAAAFMISSSFVKTMVPLRGLAVLSNVGFLCYSVMHPSAVTALLYAILLPINCVRFSEMLRLTRRVRAAAERVDLSLVWLRPYMKATRHKAGDVLFRKGDEADHLYFLAEGRVEVVEIGTVLQPGRILGEIAFFTPSGRRTASARCMDDCLVLKINKHTVRELYYQNPSFGFELVELVAARLSADVDRLNAQLAAMRTHDVGAGAPAAGS